MSLAGCGVNALSGLQVLAKSINAIAPIDPINLRIGQLILVMFLSINSSTAVGWHGLRYHRRADHLHLHFKTPRAGNHVAHCATALTLLPSRTPDITRKVGLPAVSAHAWPGFLRLNEKCRVTALHFAARGFHQFQTPHWRTVFAGSPGLSAEIVPSAAIGFPPLPAQQLAPPRLSPDAPNCQLPGGINLNAAITRIPFAPSAVCTASQPSCCNATSSGPRCNPSCRASCLHPVLTPLPRARRQ